MVIYQYPCSSSTECHPLKVRLRPGTYFIECYGAQGGRGMQNGKYVYPGGKGAYTSGIIALKQTTNFFLYIGGKGDDGTLEISHSKANGGWNGGGNAGADIGNGQIGDDNDPSGAGGGSTDIRLSESIESRIMVAAGGSGSAFNVYGVPGGDLHGYVTRALKKEEYTPSATDQHNGYQKLKGENGDDSYFAPHSGAGGGYFGGNKGEYTKSETDDGKYYLSISSSGSSYVSGYQGCPEFEDPDFIFQFPNILNGFSSFPSLTDSVYESGHEGNGAVRIRKLYDDIQTLRCNPSLLSPKIGYIMIILIMFK